MYELPYKFSGDYTCNVCMSLHDNVETIDLVTKNIHICLIWCRSRHHKDGSCLSSRWRHCTSSGVKLELQHCNQLQMIPYSMYGMQLDKCF